MTEEQGEWRSLFEERGEERGQRNNGWVCEIGMKREEREMKNDWV